MRLRWGIKLIDNRADHLTLSSYYSTISFMSSTFPFSLSPLNFVYFYVIYFYTNGNMCRARRATAGHLWWTVSWTSRSHNVAKSTKPAHPIWRQLPSIPRGHQMQIPRRSTRSVPIASFGRGCVQTWCALYRCHRLFSSLWRRLNHVNRWRSVLWSPQGS